MNKVFFALFFILLGNCPLRSEFSDIDLSETYHLENSGNKENAIDDNFSENCQPFEPACCFFNNPSVEVRCAAFFPLNSRFREVFGNVGPSYQLEFSTFTCYSDQIGVWANFDFFNQDSRNGGCRSKINIYDFSFGFKYLYPLCGCLDQFDLYAGIGLALGGINLKNGSHHGNCGNSNSENKFAAGGMLKSGVYYKFCQNLFADLFVDYLYQPVHFRHKTIDVGGIKIGLGIGYAF